MIAASQSHGSDEGVGRRAWQAWRTSAPANAAATKTAAAVVVVVDVAAAADDDKGTGLEATTAPIHSTRVPA